MLANQRRQKQVDAEIAQHVLRDVEKLEVRVVDERVGNQSGTVSIQLIGREV